MLMKNSAEFNIDLNAKDDNNSMTDGWTAFHLACLYGRTKIVDMMMDNSELFKLDLVAKDNTGQTGYMLAKHVRKRYVVNLINRKMPSIAF